jgi:amino acid transporter
MNKPEQSRGNNVPFIDAILPGLGGMLAGGVFLAPAMAADTAGPASLVALLIAAAVALALARSSVAPWVPPNRFARVAVSALGVAARALAVAALCSILAAYVLPRGSESARDWAGILAVLVATIFVALGVRTSPSAVAVATGVAVVGLGFYAGLAVPLISPSNFTPFAPHGWNAVPSAAVLMFFLFGGAEYVGCLSGVLVNPKRTIPRAALLGVAMAAAVALIVMVVSIGVGGSSFTMHRLFVKTEDRARLLLIAAATGRPAAMWGLSLAAFASCAVGIHRLLSEAAVSAASMGRLGDLPPFLGVVSPSREAPWVAAIAIGGGIIVMASWLPPTRLIPFAAWAVLLSSCLRYLWKTR